jgi:hypothetical protein
VDSIPRRPGYRLRGGAAGAVPHPPPRARELARA